MGTAVLNTRPVTGQVLDSQNFSSRSFHSSQRPKVSIGILVEKTPKLDPESRNEDVAPQLPTDEEVPGSQGKLSQRSRKKEACWVSIRPICHGKSVVKKVQSASNQNIVLETEDQLQQKLGISTCERNREKVQSVSNQNIVLETEDQLLEKLGVSACQRNREKAADFLEVKGDAFVSVEDKGKVLEKIDNVTMPSNGGSLRLKLWEILGARPSINKEVPSIEVFKEITVTPSIEKNHAVQNVKIPKVEWNSDTIKINSGLKENSRETMQRPLTRSLTRKQVPKKSLPKLKPKNYNTKKLGSSLPSSLKEQNAKKNVFSFEEKAGTLGGIKCGGGSTMSRMRTRKKSNINTSRVQPCRISFPRRSSSVETSEIAGNEDPPLPIDVTARDNCIGMMYSSPNKVDTSAPCQSNAIPGVKSQSSETKLKMNLNRHVDKYVDTDENALCSRKIIGKVNHDSRQPFVEDENTNQNIDRLPFSRNSEPQDVFQSPTFAVNIKTTSVKEVPSECVNFSTEQIEQRPTTTKTPESLYSQSSMSGSSDSDNEEEYFSKSPLGETPSLTKEESAEIRSSQSPKTGPDCDSSVGDEIANQNLRADKWFSDAGSKEAKKSLNCSKRLRSLDGINITNFTAPSASPFETARTEEMTQLMNVPKQQSDDDLERAISQLAFVLEKFKDKIRSHTRKKNSEILSSARNRIHLKLQDVESQIQADMGEFTGIAKLKRKRLESTFQEQEEKLKAIQEKFKKEVNQHLVDCRGTVEELESFQMEVKTNAERQRKSHRKLLAQVEQSIKVQLNDAETSIATSHKVARKTMNGLKHALKDWLTDCPLS